MKMSPAEVAVSVYVPVLSILQPVKAATPFAAATAKALQLRTAPEPPVSVRSMVAADVVTVFPPSSWTLMAGWVANGVPPVEPDGWVVKASLEAGPVEMVKLVLAAVKPAPVAVRV